MSARNDRLPGFTSSADTREPLGFEGDRFGPSRLPGASWGTGHMFDGMMSVPNLNRETLEFDDQVWSTGGRSNLNLLRDPKDKVLVEILMSDAAGRLQAVEQLTLPPQFSTVPNTAAFSRFEHIWGSVLFVRQMAQKQGIDPEISMQLQLRTLVSDIAHTTGSHLGDWLFQKIGGGEDQHDIELAAYLDASGISDILRKYGFDPEDVVFPDIQDWVEAPLPDLNVDRVDYAVREMNRWNDAVYVEGFSSEDFIITPDNMLAMTDQRRARVFAEGFLLLSEENWSEPTHHLILELFLLRTKLFYAEGGTPQTRVFGTGEQTGRLALEEIHPRDLMYVTDPAQLAAFALPSLAGHTLDAIMRSISQYHRQYVWPGRKERINQYMDQFSRPAKYEEVLQDGIHEPIGSAVFNSYLNEFPSTLPTGFAILSPQEARATRGPNDIDFELTPFKLRQTDPLVQTAGGFRRLSELDSSYGARLEEHERTVLRTRVARLTIPDPTTYALLRDLRKNIDAHWEERLRTSRRMTKDELNSLLHAVTAETDGAYPFMTRLEY